MMSNGLAIFFVQAEDGIRDLTVTGVQTCALPISSEHFALGPSTVVSADFPAWRDHNHAFEQVEAFGGTSGANLTGAGEPARVSVTSVTTGFFSMLGVAAVVGRAFFADEGKQGQEHVALLNEALWRDPLRAGPPRLCEKHPLDRTGD